MIYLLHPACAVRPVTRQWNFYYVQNTQNFCVKINVQNLRRHLVS